MENIFIALLPPWVETGLQPAFYDKESGTVLQQTARMYAKVNALVEAFNKLSADTKSVVEEYIAKFVELYTYVHDYFDNLDVQEEIDNKLDALVDDGTLTTIISTFLYKKLFLASELGLETTNSEAVAIANFNALKSAMEAGYNVLIDDAYYIKNTDPAKSIQIITNQTLQGKDDDSKLIVYDNQYLYLFDHNGFDITLNNLNIVNTYGHEASIIRDNTTNEQKYKYGSIYIHGCSFIGQIRIIFFDNLESNLRDETWGVPEIKFNNNFVEDCTSIISICDYNTPFGEVEINNNIIHNTYCFARIHPTHDESDTQGREFMRTIKADGNHVYNDDNVFNDTGTYCAFIVAVAETCEVTNNTIEGLKSNSTTAVYSVYASCYNFVFENNYCKNIVCFYRNNNNYVFKAKFGEGTRVCKNNTFILDETWVNTINSALASPYSDADLLNQTAYSIYHSDGGQDSWIIDNNNIQVIKLDLRTRYRDIKYFTFTNNKVVAKEMANYLAYPQTNNIVTKVNDNTFICEGDTASFCLAQVGSYTTTADIEVCNNNLFTNGKRTNVISFSGTVGNIVLDNNNIYDKSDTASTSSSARSINITGGYASLKMNSTFVSNNKTPMNRLQIGNGKIDFTERLNTLAMSDNGGSERFIFKNGEMISNKLLFTIEYIDASNQLITSHYIVNIYNDGESNYVNYVDSTDTEQTIDVTNLGSNVIKDVKTDNGSSMLTVSARTGTESFITFKNITENAKYAVLSIKSI